MKNFSRPPFHRRGHRDRRGQPVARHREVVAPLNVLVDAPALQATHGAERLRCHFSLLSGGGGGSTSHSLRPCDAVAMPDLLHVALWTGWAPLRACVACKGSEAGPDSGPCRPVRGGPGLGPGCSQVDQGWQRGPATPFIIGPTVSCSVASPTGRRPEPELEPHAEGAAGTVSLSPGACGASGGASGGRPGIHLGDTGVIVAPSLCRRSVPRRAATLRAPADR